jgi:hypothetical protein
MVNNNSLINPTQGHPLIFSNSQTNVKSFLSKKKVTKDFLGTDHKNFRDFLWKPGSHTCFHFLVHADFVMF